MVTAVENASHAIGKTIVEVGNPPLLGSDARHVAEAAYRAFFPFVDSADGLAELPLGSVVYGHLFTGSWEKSMADGLWHSPFLPDGYMNAELLDHIGSGVVLLRGDSA